MPPQGGVGIGLTGLPLRRWRSGRTREGERTALSTALRATGPTLALAGLALPALLGVACATSGFEMALVTMPLPLQVVDRLPYVVAALAAATAAGAVYSWRTGAWSRRARVHQSVLALFGAALVWPLYTLGFFGSLAP